MVSEGREQPSEAAGEVEGLVVVMQSSQAPPTYHLLLDLGVDRPGVLANRDGLANARVLSTSSGESMRQMQYMGPGCSSLSPPLSSSVT